MAATTTTKKSRRKVQTKRPARAVTPRSSAAKAKIKSKKPHRRCNVNLPDEGVKVKNSPSLKLVGAAARGDEKARTKLAGLTVKQRTRIADHFLHGLRGVSRERFIADGLTLPQQVELSRNARHARELLEEAARNQKGKSMPRTRTKKAARKPKRRPMPDGHVSAAEVAKAAGVTPKELRGYLRRNKIEKDKGSGRYSWPSLKNRTVKSIVKGVKAELVASK